MFGRARSLSRFPEDASSSFVYERSASPFSTKLSVRQPDLYGWRSHSVGPVDRGYGFNRIRRATSIPSLHASKYYSYLQSAYDPYDRYVSTMLSTPYSHFSSAHWKYSVPSTPYRYPLDYYSNSYYIPGYPYSPSTPSSVWRYADSLRNYGRINNRLRDLEYNRSLRSLRLHRPLSFYNPSSMYWLDSIPSNSQIERSEHPRNFYGRSYIAMEKSGVDNVSNRYKYITKNVQQRPFTWNAEDQVERGDDLYKLNLSTLPTIHDTIDLVNNSREGLLMDRAGVVPRVHHMNSDYLNTKSNVDYSKRLINNFKLLKDSTIARLEAPWTYGRYAN